MTPLIPHTLHRIWLGGPMPSEFVAYGAGWMAAHPEWKHILWTDAPGEQRPIRGLEYRAIPTDLKNQQLYDAAVQLAGDHAQQFRADIARYEILWRHGGVYVDADFECLRPLDSLIDPASCFAAWEVDGTWVNNAIMGCVHWHGIIGQIIDGLEANVGAHPGKRPNVLSGPQYITPIVRRDPDAVTVFPSRLFYPYLWNELDRRAESFPQAYAVHHWHNARKRRGEVAV